MEQQFTNENKFEPFEIVKIIYDETGVTQNCTGFVTNMRQFEWNGIWEYSVYVYELGSVVEYQESELETMGRSLPDEEIKRRQEIISRKSKFQFNEIVEVVRHKDPKYIGKKGYVSGMCQDYDDGTYGYGLFLFDDQRVDDGFDNEDDLISMGEFVSKEVTNSGMSLKVTTEGEVTEVNFKNPTWQEKLMTPEYITGWPGDEEE